MFRTHRTLATVLVAVSVAAFAGGCGVGTSPLTGLLSSVDPNASSLAGLLSSLDPNTTLGQLLNEITVGDVVTGVEQLLSSLRGGGGRFGPPGLGHEGGCPGDPNAREGLAAALNLTDEQKSEANAIFTSAREDIEALRQDANDQVRALLTEEQLAILDGLEPNSPNDTGPGPGWFHRPHRPHLAQDLNLTDEQKTAIKAILEQLRTDIQARKQTALDDFRAILTTDQQAILDQIEQAHRRGPIWAPAP
jgi:Spy/CpxP family protein refolding chaperone